MRSASISGWFGPPHVRRLRATLMAHVDRPRFDHEQRRQTGAVLVWDDRCTSYARTQFDGQLRRVMYRAHISDGDG